ncbi:MAG TPA: ABC transporter ATP-binding protein [Acidimicrobiales bacterium]|nr:ABC transporter ATP-binding protein [Acidimicrobiales bacterium]
MATAGGATLEAVGVRAGFGAATVLHGVDVSVGSGEVVAILGLNGAGKSVTLKVLAGLLPARAGTVRLDGEDVTALSPEQRVGRGMGHVLQGRHVFGELTVEQNLRLGAYLLRRKSPAAYQPALAGVLDRFPRLAERRSQLAGSLSGGEQAMLAVGRALMGGPRIVLVDEPTAGLSPLVSAGLVDTLEATRETGVTMLLVEQNTRFALDLADRILVMRQGVVVHDAPTDKVDHDDLAELLGIGRLLSASVAKPAAPEAAVATKKATPRKKAVAKKKATVERAAAKKVSPKKTATPKKAAPRKTGLTKKKAAVKKASSRKSTAAK